MPYHHHHHSRHHHSRESFHPDDFGDDLIIEDEFYVEDEIIETDDDDQKDTSKTNQESSKTLDQPKTEILDKDKTESKSKPDSKDKPKKAPETKSGQDSKKLETKSSSKEPDKKSELDQKTKEVDNLKNGSKVKSENDKLPKSDSKPKKDTDKSLSSISKSKISHDKNDCRDLSDEWLVNDEIIETDVTEVDEAKVDNLSKTSSSSLKKEKSYSFSPKHENIPLIGLEYGVRVKNDLKQINIYCLLCEGDSLTSSQAYKHFVSVDHQLKYMEKHFSLVRKLFPSSDPKNWDQLSRIHFTQVCQKVEKTFGRKSLLVSGPNYQKDVYKNQVDNYECSIDKDNIVLNYGNESLKYLKSCSSDEINKMLDEFENINSLQGKYLDIFKENSSKALPKDKTTATKPGLKSALKDAEDISSVEEEEIFTPLALKDAEHICSGEEESFDKDERKKSSSTLKSSSSFIHKHEGSHANKKEYSSKPLKVCKHKKPLETSHSQSKETTTHKNVDSVKRSLKDTTSLKEMPPNKKLKAEKDDNTSKRHEVHPSKEKNESLSSEHFGVSLKERGISRERLRLSPSKDHRRRSTSRDRRHHSGSRDRFGRNILREHIQRSVSREKILPIFPKERSQRSLSKDRHHRTLSRDRNRRSLSRGRHRSHSRGRRLSRDQHNGSLRDRRPLSSENLVRKIDLIREKPPLTRSPSFTRRIRMRSRERRTRSRSRERRTRSRSRDRRIRSRSRERRTRSRSRDRRIHSRSRERRTRSRSRERTHNYYIRKLGVISSGDIKRQLSPGLSFERGLSKESRVSKERERIKRYSKTPEKEMTAPKITYEEEWAKFYVRRWNQLQKAGKDPEKYDYEKEWSVYWGQLLKKMTETAISASLKSDSKEKENENVSNKKSKYKARDNIKVLKVIEPEDVDLGKHAQSPSRIFNKYSFLENSTPNDKIGHWEKMSSSLETSSQNLEPSSWEKYPSSTKLAPYTQSSSTSSLWNKQPSLVTGNKDKSFWCQEHSSINDKPSTTDTVLNALNTSLKDAPPSYRNEMVYKILSAINEDPTIKTSSQKDPFQFSFTASNSDQRLAPNQPSTSSLSNQPSVKEIATKLATILKNLGLENLPEGKLLEIINYIRGSGGTVNIEEIAKAHLSPFEQSSSYRPSFGTSLKDLPSLKDIPTFKETTSFEAASSYKDMGSFKDNTSLKHMPPIKDFPLNSPMSNYSSGSWQTKKQDPIPPCPPSMPPFNYKPPSSIQIDSILSKPPDSLRKSLGTYESEFSRGRMSHDQFSSSLDPPHSYSSLPSGSDMSHKFPSSFDDSFRGNYSQPSGPHAGPPPSYGSTFSSQGGYSSLPSGPRMQRPPIGNFQLPPPPPHHSWMNSPNYRPQMPPQFNKPPPGGNFGY